jgi:VanZ family protein
MLRDRTRRVLALTGIAYGVICLLIGFWPTPVDRPIDGLLARVLGFLHAHGVPQFIGYSLVEFWANVALFVPVGAVLAALAPRRLWWAPLVLGVELSAVIELIQFDLLPARVASVGDVAANSLGTAIGVGITALLLRSRAPAAV